MARGNLALDASGECLVMAQDEGARDERSLADAYADWRASTLGRITDALERDVLLELIRPSPRLLILDVGCGDGAFAVDLAARGAEARQQPTKCRGRGSHRVICKGAPSAPGHSTQCGTRQAHRSGRSGPTARAAGSSAVAGAAATGWVGASARASGKLAMTSVP